MRRSLITARTRQDDDSRFNDPAEPPRPHDEPVVEVSVVMPCLNEADTIESCITKAQQAFREHGIRGEVIVADNGSTDESPAIAARVGARVVPVVAKGYGNALMGGGSQPLAASSSSWATRMTATIISRSRRFS